MNKQITIGITDCKKYDNYYSWIMSSKANIKVIKLSYTLKNEADVAYCNGLLLTGGEDVHPSMYNKPNYLTNLDTEQIDIHRDTFEKEVILKALSLKMPILGICRGLQITNVVLGGTLVYDIPTVLNEHIHGKINGIDQVHRASFKESSLINKITSQKNGEINSAHHQSVEILGEGLTITGIADKNIVEAIEWENPANKSWLLLVQWHPERMKANNPISTSILQTFLHTVASNQHSQFD